MKRKSCHTRREFLEGVLFAGAAFAFSRPARGGQNGGEKGDFGTPLVTEQIPQPDGMFCALVGFSPVNDQAAFIAGTYDNMALYVSKPGQPESFDVLWQPDTDLACVKAGAWSPDGKEIAFLVQAVNETVPKSARISIYVADVASKAVREPIVIAEAAGKEEKQYVNASYKKGLAWLDNSFVCVPADTPQGGILKFDTRTGQSETLMQIRDDANVSKMVRARSGELCFVEARGLKQGNDGQFLLCGLAQDGTIREHTNLTEQIGTIFSANVSQDGDFVFAEKGDMWSPDSITNIIYKIEARSVISQIPRFVRQQRDMYSYIPLTVRNGNELILMEMVSLAVDGGSLDSNRQIRIVKMAL